MTEQLVNREQLVEKANLVFREARKQIVAFDKQHPKHFGLDPEWENLSYVELHAEMILDDINSGKETEEDAQSDFDLMQEYLQYLGLTITNK